MRVEIEINGHQTYEHIIGDVLHWGSGIVRIGDSSFAVPCVVVQTTRGVRTINLQQPLRSIVVKELAP